MVLDEKDFVVVVALGLLVVLLEGEGALPVAFVFCVVFVVFFGGEALLVEVALGLLLVLPLLLLESVAIYKYCEIFLQIHLKIKS